MSFNKKLIIYMLIICEGSPSSDEGGWGGSPPNMEELAPGEGVDNGALFNSTA